jgi:hypothetical protein
MVAEVAVSRVVLRAIYSARITPIHRFAALADQLFQTRALGLLGLTSQAVFFLALGAFRLSQQTRFLLLTQPLLFLALTLLLLTRAALLSSTLLGRRRSLLTALFFLCALLGSRLGLPSLSGFILSSAKLTLRQAHCCYRATPTTSVTMTCGRSTAAHLNDAIKTCSVSPTVIARPLLSASLCDRSISITNITFTPELLLCI